MNRALVPCTVGARGADTNTRLEAEEAAALRAAGFDWVTRYLSLSTPNAGDLSASELAGILGAGLGLMAVQHVRFAGWTPSATLGANDGAAAARHAVTCGIPRSAILWVDLEGVATSASAADVAAHVDAWTTAVHAGGYDAGAYVGAGLPQDLDAAALWHLAVERYWRSQSAVPNVSNRGYQLLQLYPQCKVGDVFPSAPELVHDIMIDVDVAQADYRGSKPTMLVQTP